MVAGRELLLRGPYGSPTGFGHHTRSLARAFADLGRPLQLEEDTLFAPEGLAPDDDAPARALAAARASGGEADAGRVPGATLQVTLPTLVRHDVPAPNALYTMFEADRAPARWVERARACDLVLVPTESSLEAYAQGGVPRAQLHLAPLGIDAERFAQPAEPLPLATADGRPLASFAARFLYVGDLLVRKNIPGLVRAWLRATRADDDAVLVIKAGGLHPLHTVALFRAVESAARAAGRRFAEAAPIVWLRARLRDDELPRLYAGATHYLSLSFGEGWDFPMHEAGAAGLRLIAPAHSAYTAWLDAGCARLLPARLVDVVESVAGVEHAPLVAANGDTHRLFEGARWWSVEEEAAVEAIREAVVRPQGPWPRDPARLRALTWRASAQRVGELLDAALREAHPPRPG